MKRGFCLGLVTTALVLACYTLAGQGSGQGDQAPKVNLKNVKATVERLQSPVTLDLVDTPFKDTLMLVEQFSQLKFGWDYETLPGEKTLRLSANDEPLGEALQKALNAIKWTYAIQPDGEILLRPVPTRK